MSAYSKTQPTPVASGPKIGVTPCGSLLEMVDSFSSTRLRAAQLCLAGEQEGRLGRDVFPFAEARQHLVIIARHCPDLDLRRLKLSLSSLDERIPVLPRGEQRIVGYRQAVPERHLHVH